MLVRMWRNRNTDTLLVAMKVLGSSLKSWTQLPYGMAILLSMDFTCSGYSLSRWKLDGKKSEIKIYTSKKNKKG